MTLAAQKPAMDPALHEIYSKENLESPSPISANTCANAPDQPGAARVARDGIPRNSQRLSGSSKDGGKGARHGPFGLPSR